MTATPPETDDHQALADFRAYCNAHGPQAVAERHGVSKRRIQRIYTGAAPLSPSLAKEIAEARKNG